MIRTMKFSLLILQLLSVVTLLGAARPALAQSLPSPMTSGVDAALTRLFGEHKAFSAEAVIRVYDKDEQETVSSTLGFAVDDGSVRMDVDMTRLKTRDLPAGIAGSLKQVGMDKVVCLILPEKQSSYLIYPGLQCMLKLPIDEAASKHDGSDFQLDRVKIGSETLDGHVCTKYRVTVTDAAGETEEATTWNAVDMQEFPLQIQMADGENQMILRFRSVKRVAPKAALFALPAGYTQYDSQEALMQAVMMKVLGGLGDMGGE